MHAPSSLFLFPFFSSSLPPHHAQTENERETMQSLKENRPRGRNAEIERGSVAVKRYMQKRKMKPRRVSAMGVKEGKIPSFSHDFSMICARVRI
jgi:hypothetical protein